VAEIQPHQVKENRKDLLIANRSSIKESNRSLVTKEKEISSQAVSDNHSFGFFRFLDNNYQEKLLNLNGVQKEIFKQLAEKGIIPMHNRNSSTDLFARKTPFIGNDTRKNVMSQKLVDNALDKIKVSIPLELAIKNQFKPPDDSKKLLHSLKKKRSYNKFKSQLAGHGSMVKLTRKNSQNTLTPENLTINRAGRQLENPSLDWHDVARSPSTFISGISPKKFDQKRMFVINQRHDQVIKNNRDARNSSNRKDLMLDDSNNLVESLNGYFPFITSIK
jgi:hypothetical protein